jgi:FkbM family methyltransferase
MRLFRLLRSRDINLELAVASEKSVRELIVFNDSALNSFDKNLSNLREDIPEYRVLRKKEVQTHRLEDILSQYIDSNQEIDFLSVDVEGLDLEVLQSNDWNTFRPKYVLVECIELDLEKLEENETFRFMANLKYQLISKTFYAAIFRDSLIVESCI